MALLDNGSALVPVMDVTLDDLNILEVGSLIQIAGAIWSGNGKVYLAPLPDEDLNGDLRLLKMDAAQWERFLNQTDVLDIRGPGKAILRKSQRLIDQHMAWAVFERDGYRCRYCGIKAPLTVDHIIPWSQNGATVAENLLSSCRRDNKLRGDMEYAEWLDSPDYRRVSAALLPTQQYLNRNVIEKLDELRKIVAKPRSR